MTRFVRIKTNDRCGGINYTHVKVGAEGALLAVALAEAAVLIYQNNPRIKAWVDAHAGRMAEYVKGMVSNGHR